MEIKKKPGYNMWQGTAFMLRKACKYGKMVIFTTIFGALLAAGKSIAQMLIAPVIISKIEVQAPPGQLLAVIGIFAAVLIFCAGFKAYLDAATTGEYVSVRMSVNRAVGGKVAATSYPNTLNAAFINLEKKAWEICSSNASATEAIWSTWTGILTNVLGFIVYFIFLANLSPWVMVLVVVTTAAGYFISKKINT